jgi:uncharacterized protein YjdB
MKKVLRDSGMQPVATSLLAFVFLLVCSLSQAQPVITNVSPLSGKPGTTVTITGSGFNTVAANNVVRFGAMKGTVTAASATSLTVTVPTGPTYDAVTVVNTGTHLSGRSRQFFLPSVDSSGTYTTYTQFVPSFYLDIMMNPDNARIVDVDADGKNDIVTERYGFIEVYRNKSTSPSSFTFDSALYDVPGYAYTFNCADIDGDGKPEILAGLASGGVAVLKNNCTPGNINSSSFVVFQLPGGLLSYYTPTAISADIDGDGNMDIIAYGSGEVAIYRNLGGPATSTSFAAPIMVAGSGDVYSLECGDVDGDGKPDLVAAASGVKLYRNISTPGSINFAPRVGIVSDQSPISIKLTDVDMNGKPDILFCNSGWGNKMCVISDFNEPGNIDTTLFSVLNYRLDSGFYSFYPSVYDFNSDGKPDFLFCANGFYGSVELLFSKYSSAPIDSTSYLHEDVPISYGESVALGDINGDGAPDFVENGTSWFSVDALPYLHAEDRANLCKGDSMPVPLWDLSIWDFGYSWYTYSSSNPAIASVDPYTGMITGQNEGTAIITAASPTRYLGSQRWHVTVRSSPSPTSGAAMICAGTTTVFANDSVSGTWSSGDNSVATITAAGSVTGLTGGITQISYTVSTGCSRITQVTVNPNVPNISGDQVVCVGGSGTLTDALSGGTWTSSNAGVVSIDSSGIYTGVSLGTAVITYSAATDCGMAYATRVVAVAPAATNGSLSGSSSVCIGSTDVLSNTSGYGEWNSSNSAVATVDFSGVVSGIGNGTAIISYRNYNGCEYASGYATMVVTVGAVPSITGNLSVCIGATSSLAASISGGVWSVSGSSVALIDVATGLLTGVGSGTTTVTYTSTNACGTGAAVRVITVIANPTTVSISGASTEKAGALEYFTPSVLGGTWTSGNTAIAKVNGDGAVGGVAAGTAVISYTLHNSCGDAVTAKSITVQNACVSMISTIGSVGFSQGLSTDKKGNIYYLESIPGVIYKMDTAGIVTHVAGVGTPGYSGDGGYAMLAEFYSPTDVAVDAVGNMYVADYYNFRVRKIDTNGIITTFAGMGPVDHGILDGDGALAILHKCHPWGVCIDHQQNVLVADMDNVIYKITPDGLMYTIAGTGTFAHTGDGGLATAAQLAGPSDVAVDDSDNIYIIEGMGSVRKVSAATGIITTIAGTGVWGFSGDGGPAISAQMDYTTSACVDHLGNVYICDVGNHRIRKVSADGIISTLTGNGVWDDISEEVPTSEGIISLPYNIAIDNKGNLILANTAIKKITPGYTAGVISGADSVSAGATIMLSNTAVAGAWSSSNNTYATVSTSGVVTGVAQGTATVSYTFTDDCGAHSLTKLITVTQGAIAGDSAICVGATGTLTTITTGGTWSSGNTAIATISSTGIVSGVAGGAAVITYSTASTISTKVITVDTVPDAGGISGVASLCASATTTLSSSFAGGTWNSGAVSIATVGANTGVITGVSAGTAMVTYVVTNSCGSANATVVVTVNAATTAGSITGTLTVCVSTNTTLSNTVTGGTWSSSNSAIAAVNASTGVVSGVGAGNTTITYTVNGVCGTATMTAAVTVNAATTAGSITGTLTVCASNSTTLSNTTTGGTWSSSNISVASVNALTGAVSGVSAGTTTISYAVSGTCSVATTTAVVTVNAATSAGIITGTMTVCQGANTTLSNATTGGIWSGSNTAIATVGSSSGVVSGVSAGNTTVSYTVTGTCGTATTTAMVTVNAATTAGSITGTLTVCASNNTTLSNTTTGGNWTSSNAAVATIGSASGVVSGVSAGNTTITYSVNGTCGAANSTAVVTVNAVPSAGTITGATSVNVSAATTLIATVTGGAWTASNGNATVSSGGVVTGVAAGTVTISYTVSGACGSPVATKVLTVTAPVSGTTGTLTVCSGSTTTLSNTTTGGTWSSANNGVASVTSGGVVTVGAAGVVLISYTTAGGIATSSVTVLALPNTITGTMSLCSGAATTLASTTTGGSWMSGNTTVASIGSTGIISGVAAGNTVISYTGINDCTRTATVTVVAQPAVSGTTTLCAGSTTTLTPSVTGGAWGGGSTVAGVSNGVVTAGIAGTTTITYTIGSLCRSVIPISVNALPSVIGGSAKVCPGTTVTLTDAITGGTWSSDNGSIVTVNATSGAITGVVAGTTIVSYTAPNGCSRSVVATVNPGPAAIGGTASTCAGSATTLTNTSATYSWTSSSTSIATITSTGIVTGVNAGTANITFTAAGTYCTANTVVTINGTPAAIGGSATACIGSTTTLSNTTVGGTWSSSNSSIASIDAVSGVVTGVTAGSVTMTYATGSGCYKTKALTVGSAVAITGTTTACTGGTTTLSSWGSGTWSSNNTAVANIPTASIGAVQGMSAGTAIITFLPTGSCPAVTTVTIVAPPAAITGTTVICSGQTSSLSTTSTGGTWSSSNTAVATIGSATGVVNGVGNSGTVTITYAYNATCRTTTNFTVNPLPNVIGGTYSVCATATTTLSDVTAAGTWSSSNTAVATVGTGINWGYGAVSGLTAGTTNISYTISATGCARSVVVTVDACSRPMGNTGTILQLYPNPTTGAFTVVTESSGTLQVFTLDGREVAQYTISNGINNLALSKELTSGVYMCRYNTNNGNTVIVRLVLEH